jgi:hypothetical protein
MRNPDERFQFDIECDVLEKARPDGSTGRFIAGFVSTDHMDRQGEVLLQKGLDFTPFLERGWFNDNHDSATDALVGYPTMAEMRKAGDGHTGWYVEGELLEGAPRADRLWSLAQSLSKSGKRKLGFSVEGKILDRDPRNPKAVRKAEVHEVAITRCPVNTKTALEVLAKSLAVGSGSAVAGEATAGSAKPLQPEALEGIGTRRKKRRKIRKSAAVEFLRLVNPRVPRALAERIVEYTARHHNAA